MEAGVNHIDTAQFYGPDVANELLHEALYPYPDDLVLVSKVGAARNDKGEWMGAQRPEELRAGVEANLKALELEQVPVVNLRRHPESDVPFADQLGEMIALRDEGLIGGIGLSNASLEQYRMARARTEVACVQNAYNLADRSDQAVFDACRADGVPYVPFFPLGSAFHPENPVLGGRRSKRRPAVSGPLRPRWRWPGCCTWRPMSCSSRGRPHWSTWTRTWPPASSYSTRRLSTRCPAERGERRRTKGEKASAWPNVRRQPRTNSAMARMVVKSPLSNKVVAREARQASRSSRIFSTGPMSAMSSISAVGTAAAASSLRPSR